MSIATFVPPVDNPLSREHHHELELAGQRAKSIRRAARVASFNGWMTAIAAAVCAPFALLDFTTFVMTAGLAVVAYNEFCGRRRLLQFDPEAARLLGFNQIGLLTLIVLYCLWMLYSGLTSANPIAAELAATPGAADLLGPLDEVDVLYRQLVVTLYGTVIVLTAIFQGLNALYYFSRRRHIEAYVADTPEWVRDLQRSSNA